jgi:phosphate transport system substrate-binding protein
MMHSTHVRIAAAAATIALVFATAAPAFAAVSLTISGSTTLMPLAQKWASVYKSLHGGSIQVTGGGSGKGVTDTHSGITSMGMSSAVKNPSDPNAKDLIFTPVARDAVVIVVNPSISGKTVLYQMTPALVRRIFLGQVTNWHQVDSRLPSHSIDLKGRNGTSGTYTYFKSVFLKSGEKQSSRTAQYSSNGMVRSAVAGDKYAIGYLAMSYVTTHVRALNLLMNSGPQAGHYVVPTRTNALNGKYIYVRDLFFLTRGAPAGDAKTFINWCLTSKGQSYNAAVGYLPLH